MIFSNFLKKHKDPVDLSSVKIICDKNVEALAHGLPLVTTTHGARGIETGINTAFLVANEADDFVQSICAVIEGVKLRKRLNKNAHKFIKDNFSPEKCFEPFYYSSENT